MTLETVVNDLTTTVETLVASVQDKRTVLDNAAVQGAGSLATARSHLTTAKTKVTEAATSATAAANALAQVTAYKTAATALNTATTATQAVTNLLPDMLAKKDPARHPFRKKMPTLVLDFERQRCHRYSPETGYGETPLNSFMTFTRASTATYTGPDGLIKTAAVNEPRYDYDPITGECKGILIEEQRTNLRTYSAFPLKFFGAIKAVLTQSNIVSPDGTLTNGVFERGSTGNGSYAMLGSAVTIGTQTSFVFSLYVKKRDARYVSLRIQESTVYSSMSNAMFDLDAGTVSLQATNVGEYTEADCGITAAGAGWFRVWIKAKTGALPTAYGLFSCSDIPTAVIDGLATVANLGVYFYGPQLELGAFPTSYIPTPAVFTGRASTATYLDANGVLQTAASGVARSNAYDYDADGVLRPVGLLLENSATNLLTQSQDFSSWGITAASRAGTKASAPDGSLSGTPITPTAGATLNSYQTQISFGAFDGTRRTFSAYVKSNGLNKVRLRLVDNATSASASVVVNLSDGSLVTPVIDNASWTGVSYTVTKLSGGWLRISVTGTGVGGGTVTAGVLPYDSVKTVGDGVSGIYLWGAQLETGSYPTSYIPTTSAQVTRDADTSTSAQATRSADNASVTGSNFAGFYNQTQGTIVAAARFPNIANGTYQRVVSVNGGSYLNSAEILVDGVEKKWSMNMRNAGALLAAANLGGAASTGAYQRISLRIKKDDAAVSAGGAAAISDTSVTLPAMTRLDVGNQSGATNILNGHISNITYYPQPFTNEELQTFTAP